MQFLLNVVFSALLISSALWVSKKNPVMGGFIVSLPLSTLVVLVMSKIQNPNVDASFNLAKSVFIGIPATALFFIPFLVAGRFKLSFWTCYGSGVFLLAGAYFAHRLLTGYLMK